MLTMKKISCKLATKIYLDAAERLFIKTPSRVLPIYACRAISHSAHYMGLKPYLARRLRLEFRNIFAKDKDLLETWWKAYVNIEWTDKQCRNGYIPDTRKIFRKNLSANQNLLTQRTIALCLMAHLAKDGQLNLSPRNEDEQEPGLF